MSGTRVTYEVKAKMLADAIGARDACGAVCNCKDLACKNMLTEHRSNCDPITIIALLEENAALEAAAKGCEAARDP